jgi:lipoprotein NlpD
MKKTAFSSGVGRLAGAVLALGLAACTSNVPAPVVGQNGAATQAARADTYVVRSGDTLHSIARAYDMDFSDLIGLNVNEIQNPDQLSIGQVVRISPRMDTSAPVAYTAPVTSDAPVIVRPIGNAPVPGRQPGTESNTELLKREPKAGKEQYSEQALAAAQSEGQSKPAATVSPAATVVTPAATVSPAVTVAPAATAPASAGKGPWIWPASGKVVTTFDGNGSKGIDIAGKAGDPVIASGGGRVVYVGTGLRGYGKLVIVRHDATFLSAYAHNQNILVKEGQSVTQGQRIAEMGNTDADRVKLHFEIRSTKSGPVDPLRYLPRR